MKILVINPNTSKQMTEDIALSIEKIQSKMDKVIVTNPSFGPESLESFYDYSLATVGSIAEIKKHSDIDGVLLACFGDPGLYSIKEKYSFPTIGIAEAALSMSLLMGKKFSLLVASEKAVPMMEDMVRQYGLVNRLASIETIGMKVLDIEKSKENSIKNLVQAGEKALSNGGEVLILACAGMTNLRDEVSEILKVPIIDPVLVGYKMLESMLSLNLGISKVGLYKEPFEKEILNKDLLNHF